MLEKNQDRPTENLTAPAAAMSTIYGWDFDEEREASVQISRYEAKMLLAGYLTSMIGIEAERDLLEVYSSTSLYRWHEMDGRLRRLVDAGLLTTDEMQAEFAHARKRQGLSPLGESQESRP